MRHQKILKQGWPQLILLSITLIGTGHKQGSNKF